MPKLTIISNGASRVVDFMPGVSVRDVIDAAGAGIRSGCLGNGACGLCLVRVEAGQVNEPTKIERVLLPPEKLAENTRLACQLMPEHDLAVQIINVVSKRNWRDLPLADVHYSPRPEAIQASDMRTGYGLAVDLGTTHLSLSLWDLSRGRRLGARAGLNPQAHYGADVITRLIAAGQSADNARQIARLALDAVHEALTDMCLRRGLHPEETRHVMLVGNTPMLALLAGTGSQTLLEPRSWTQPMDCTLNDAQTWARVLEIHPEAAVEVVAPLAGFVGSDLLAGVLATGLSSNPGSLLVDFGTNSEIALWDGHTLWVTSAAGGPAFEGSGMRCGMPAEPGAIYQAERRPDSGELALQVIGGGEAKGICGSGLVDLVADLRGSGTLKRTGRFNPPQAESEFRLEPTQAALRLTHADVDLFQRAKAAIGVGIGTLLERAGMRPPDLSRVCVCGAFGQHLNVRNAQLVGLLPDVPPDCVELCGNTALAGCEHLLVSSSKAGELATLRGRAVVVNLSDLVDFDERFLENLYIGTMKMSIT